MHYRGYTGQTSWGQSSHLLYEAGQLLYEVGQQIVADSHHGVCQAGAQE